jgi:heme/copper-type cytochrome/quinol oxidase subunit 3
MESVMSTQRQRIHPHKFALWVAIASIIMMFAGLTSAYIVKSSQANWVEVETPKEFWYSTAVMLLSSLTIQLALRAFKQREMKQYRALMALTVVWARPLYTCNGRASTGCGTTVSVSRGLVPVSSYTLLQACMVCT